VPQQLRYSAPLISSVLVSLHGHGRTEGATSGCAPQGEERAWKLQHQGQIHVRMPVTRKCWRPFPSDNLPSLARPAKHGHWILSEQPAWTYDTEAGSQSPTETGAEQEALGTTEGTIPLMQHGLHGKWHLLWERVSLPSNDKGVHRHTPPTILLLFRVFDAAGTCFTEPLPSTEIRIHLTETLPYSGSKNIYSDRLNMRNLWNTPLRWTQVRKNYPHNMPWRPIRLFSVRYEHHPHIQM
jgi:hypothetical protein